MMRRVAILLLLLPSVQCGVAESSFLRDTTNTGPNDHTVSVSHQQRRELGAFTWWVTFLNALHCPPGPLGKHCHHKRSSGSGGGSSGGSSSSSSNSYYSGNGYASDSENTSALNGDEEGGRNIWPFIAAALVAGMIMIGAGFMVCKKRRQEEEKTHPLEGSLEKRMKVNNGGVFGNGKGGDEEITGTSSYVEISSVRSSTSKLSRTGSAASIKSSSSRMSYSGSYRSPAVEQQQVKIETNF